MSLWLNSGVPATEVARRAGHGVAVLLSVYANCIDGQAAPPTSASAKRSMSLAATDLTPGAPAWVLPCRLLDQHGELSIDRRPATF